MMIIICDIKPASHAVAWQQLADIVWLQNW